MKLFDDIIKKTLLQLEDYSSNTSSDSLHAPIQNFLKLSPDDQKRIADAYSTYAKNSATQSGIMPQSAGSMDPATKAAFDAYQAGSSSNGGQSSSTITTPTQAQAQTADASGSEPGISKNNTPSSNVPMIP
jgi:hypothetical protein